MRIVVAWWWWWWAWDTSHRYSRQQKTPSANEKELRVWIILGQNLEIDQLWHISTEAWDEHEWVKMCQIKALSRCKQTRGCKVYFVLCFCCCDWHWRCQRFVRFWFQSTHQCCCVIIVPNPRPVECSFFANCVYDTQKSSNMNKNKIALSANVMAKTAPKK